MAEKVQLGNINGRSAYQIAVEEGFSGTEAEWLESLKGDVTPAAEEARDAAVAAAGAASGAASAAESAAARAEAVPVTNDGIMAPILADPDSASGAQLRNTIANPSTDVNLLENFGEASPKVLRIRSSSTPGVGVGQNAGRSVIFEVGDSRAKSMIDYRFPVRPDGAIWDFRDGAPPENSYKSVAWMGVCHYMAQDQIDHENPTDLHNHISILEMPDENLNLHTIFDSPIGSEAEPGRLGANSHRIRTNRSDFVVRVGNPFDPALGRAFRLKISAQNEYEKFISFHADTSGTAALRWLVGVTANTEGAGDTGSEFVLRPFGNNGESQVRPTVMFARRDGKTTFGQETTYPARVTAYSNVSTDDVFRAQPNSLAADRAAFFARMGSVGAKALRVSAGASEVERFSLYGDGKHGWRDASGVEDAVLYRSAAGRIKTDGELAVGSNVRVGDQATAGGAGVIAIAAATTVPNSNPSSGGGVLYVEAGALKYRGSSGTVTTIGPA